MANFTEIWLESGTWTCPDGVTSIDVEMWAAGGGSGGASSSVPYGAGGGGGAYSKSTGISVTPGNTYAIVVGTPGTGGGTGTSGGNGGDSSFATTTVVAKGGVGGTAHATAAIGGTGGQAAAGTGDTKFSGGAGADRSSSVGGAGGGGAGTRADGSAGSGNTGGAGGSAEGGTGGASPSAQNNGSFGTPFASGSGGSYSTGLGFIGRAGSRGEVRITYDETNVDWDIKTKFARLDFDPDGQFALFADLARITPDPNHFIAVWQGSSVDGFVQVLAVNTTTWQVTTAAAVLEFETQDYSYGAIAEVDENHFIIFFAGTGNDGYTQVFTVNTTTWAVTTAAASLEFDTTLGTHNACFQIDTNHFINVWSGSGNDGFAQVFTVNTTTWAVTTAAATLEFDTQSFTFASIKQIDENHFIVWWRGPGTVNIGFVQVLAVNTTTWAVTTAGAKIEYDDMGNLSGDISTRKIDDNHFIAFWEGTNDDGYLVVYEVNTTTWAIT